jgi:phosphoenolpyruvate phosphomutase
VTAGGSTPGDVVGTCLLGPAATHPLVFSSQALEVSMLSPTVGVQELLARPRASVVVGVHNALGAKIAEEAGADGLWISSFEVHAAARLPDADILGTQDYVDVISKIVDRVGIPVLVDGNAGGGNAINTIRLVREYAKAGASGMCIEDNPYPKRCSFYDGMQEELERSSTFCGKLDAALEKRLDSRFAVIARTEALIKGKGPRVALERCKEYATRGVDGILIHHKESDPREVLYFADQWYRTEETPLVCVPTTYNQVSYEQLDSAGFRLIIFANYGIRSIVRSLQETFQTIMKNRCLADANDEVVDMDEVFRLIYVNELKENEARYVR